MVLIRVKARTKGVTGYINCGRGTWLGNIFPLNKYPREKSLKFYRHYLNWRIRHDRIFREYLLDLQVEAKEIDVFLGCTCKLEESCHIDVLIEVINEL